MLYLFADDNKIYKVIKNPTSDRSDMQIDLDKLYDWSKLWLMKIHPDKLYGVEIGGWRENPQYDYTVGPMAEVHTGPSNLSIRWVWCHNAAPNPRLPRQFTVDIMCEVSV